MTPLSAHDKSLRGLWFLGFVVAGALFDGAVVRAVGTAADFEYYVMVGVLRFAMIAGVFAYVSMWAAVRETPGFAVSVASYVLAIPVVVAPNWQKIASFIVSSAISENLADFTLLFVAAIPLTAVTILSRRVFREMREGMEFDSAASFFGMLFLMRLPPTRATDLFMTHVLIIVLIFVVASMS